MNAKIVIKKIDGSVFEETKLLSFLFIKDAYIPYTTVSAQIYSNDSDYLSICEISMYIGNTIVHHGLVDSLELVKSSGHSIVRLSSRGFTSLLCQNQIEPGMITGISLNKLMDSYYSLPYVTHESNTDESNYIFVKNNSTMWDGIVNLSYKLCGTFPYIRETNCVRITAVNAPTNYSYESSKLINSGLAYNYKRMISNFHMADINGEYGTYELEDSDSINRKIVRHKFFELDKQFLYSPQDALVFRDKYSQRGSFRYFCQYNGYNGEDLFDNVTFENVNQKKITRIEVNGSKNGIFTELSSYRDRFLSL